MTRILVFYRNAWKNNDATGNTLSNIFRDELASDRFEVHYVYSHGGRPETDVVKSIYKINESSLAKSCLTRRPVGGELPIDKDGPSKENTTTEAGRSGQSTLESSMYARAKKGSTRLLYFMREFIWLFGNWRNDNFRTYLRKVQPDVVFFPGSICWFPYKILKFIRQNSNAKVVMFLTDDVFTLRQYSLSPLYWSYRFILRKWFRRAVKISDLVYAISDVQKQDFERIYRKPCKLLTKMADFGDSAPLKDSYGSPLKLVYTGNLVVGRWKSIAAIGRVLHKLDPEGKRIQMDVYSASVMTPQMLQALSIPNSVNFKGAIPATEVQKVQEDADVLVHVESFELRSRLLTRQSFSTKIVDYLRRARCVLAVGKKSCASIDYFERNELGLVAENEQEIERRLREVLDDPQILNQYAQKSWKYGKENHAREKIQKMLIDDFEALASQKQ